MSAEDRVTLQCPACNVKVKGKPALAEKSRSCPKCKATVQFELVNPPAVGKGKAVAPSRPLSKPVGAQARRKKGSPGSNSCAECGSSMEKGAVVCIECGHNTRYGMNAKTVHGAKKAGSLGVALGVGVGAAFLGGIIWAVIAAFAGAESGYVAWGVGVLTGFAVSLTTQERSFRVGAMAAGLAVFGLLIGKVLTVNWVFEEEMRKEVYRDESAMRGGLILEKMQQGKVPEDLQAWYTSDDEEIPEAIQEDLVVFEAKIDEELQDLAASDKDRLAGLISDTLLADISYADRVKATLSPFDVLWFLLAVGSAFKMGAGGGDGG